MHWWEHSWARRRQRHLDFLTRVGGPAAILLCCFICSSEEVPSDVHLTLAVSKSPAVYHMGERIVCELSFSASTRGKYGISNTAEPRGSWGAILDKFITNPHNGTVDPHVDL